MDGWFYLIKMLRSQRWLLQFIWYFAALWGVSQFLHPMDLFDSILLHPTVMKLVLLKIVLYTAAFLLLLKYRTSWMEKYCCTFQWGICISSDTCFLNNIMKAWKKICKEGMWDISRQPGLSTKNCQNLNWLIIYGWLWPGLSRSDFLS